MWPVKRTKRPDKSRQAIAEANVHLQEVESRAEEVHEVVDLFILISERNHFAEQLRAVMGPKHSGGKHA